MFIFFTIPFVRKSLSLKLDSHIMRFHDNFFAAIVSIAAGLILFKWQFLATMVGWNVHIDRGDSLITMEYVIGLAVAFVLGFSFPKHPVLCAVWFMLGHSLVSILTHIAAKGVPNLLPVEIMFLIVLTVPYVGLAYAGAYVYGLRKKGINGV